VGQPDDIANWVVFLASERARHAVGIEINVSGGQLFA
jgi:NAD(P)-dependent dehydrogenase (short-subunit alcohol dehydrogenase family)